MATLTQTLPSSTEQVLAMDSDPAMGTARIVRFDSECVLIPELPATSRLPLVLTKSYSLPLWKKATPRHTPSTAPIDEEGDGEGRARSPNPEDSRVVIKVPIPLFRRRSSRSPGPHGHTISTSSVMPKTLPSCLVHRPPTSSTSTSLPISPLSPPALSPVRRATLPASHPRREDLPPLLTVPLRACCAACEAATEHALAEGDQWKEHFSRGARRRRSASLESHQSYASLSSSPPHPSLLSRTMSPPPPSSGVLSSFAGLSAGTLDHDLARPHPNALHMIRGGAAAATAFALRVDEVDQRRRPFSFSNEEGHYAALRAEASTSTSKDAGASTSGASTSTSGASKQPLYEAARRASSSSSPSSSSTNFSSASSSASTSTSASSKSTSYSSSPSSYTAPYAPTATYPNSADALLVVPDAYRLRASPIAEEDSEDGGSKCSSVSASVVSLNLNTSTQPSVTTTGSRPVPTRRASGASTRSTTRVTRSSSVYTHQDNDDEGQLFPLPKRSPSSTPSPRASPVPSLNTSGSRWSPSVGFAPSPSGSVSSLVVPGAMERRGSGGRRSPLSSPTEKEVRRIAKEGEVQEEEEVDLLGASLSRRSSAREVGAGGVRGGAAAEGGGGMGLKIDTSANASAEASSSAGTNASVSANAGGTSASASTTAAERRPLSPRGPRSKEASSKDRQKEKETDGGLVISVSVSAAPSVSPTPPLSTSTGSCSSSSHSTTLLPPSISTHTPTPAHINLDVALEAPIPTLPAGAAMPVDVHSLTGHHGHFHLPAFEFHHGHAHERSESASSALALSATSEHAHAHTHSVSSSPPTAHHQQHPHQSPGQRRKASFTFAAPLAVLREAGADVLKGVSAIGMGVAGVSSR